MLNLTQFQLKLNKTIVVKGEFVGNDQSGKVVVFSHGFGVTRNNHGMFKELGDKLKDKYLIVRFDYNKIAKSGNKVEVYPYSTQVKELKLVINYIKRKFNQTETNIIAQSMGCIVAGLLGYFDNLNKVILNSPPIFQMYIDFKRYFSKRSGTVLNELGISKIERSDGSWTYINKDFWPEIKSVNPVTIYRNLSDKCRLYLICAKKDHILTKSAKPVLGSLGRIKYFEIDSDHDFSRESRSKWLRLNDKILSEI